MASSSFVYSRYNHVFEREGICLLYNSLSNSFVELDKESYDMLKNIQPGEKITSLPEPLYEMLLRIKGLVEDDSHEIDKIKYLILQNRFRSDRMHLTLNPTTSCNFACPYCFEFTHQGKTMTDKVENDIVDFVKAHPSVKELNITWFGGEPLLAFHRVESLSKKLIDLNLNYIAGMITNGYLFTEEIAKKLTELKISRVQITLDGPEESHNQRRYLRNGAPTYNRILESIDVVLKHAPNVRVLIRVNIDGQNAEAFLPLYDSLMEKFDRKISISPAFTGDSNDKGMSCLFDKKQQQAFMTELFH